MTDINMVVISGTLADTPRQIATQKGSIGASFRLKVIREYNGREFSSHYTCKHFGEAAQAVLSSAPGTPLLVTGRLDVDSWDDRSGQKRYETVVKADTVAGYQPSGSAAQSQHQPQQRSWYGGQQQQQASQSQYGQRQYGQTGTTQQEAESPF